jgi:hypothetical protein
MQVVKCQPAVFAALQNGCHFSTVAFLQQTTAHWPPLSLCSWSIYCQNRWLPATFLHTLTTCIAAIEAKLTKARQIKHGMMQELLTVRIRLV